MQNLPSVLRVTVVQSRALSLSLSRSRYRTIERQRIPTQLNVEEARTAKKNDWF
jgi:hypothetical protein